MDIVDADWLKTHIARTGTPHARLAEAMNLTRDKLAKILAGKRRVTTEEAARAVKFFDATQGTASALTVQEAELLQAFRDAPPSRRKEALDFLLFLKSREESRED